MEKLVSIVIPVLNREDTLPRLFRSLRAVTYRNVEIIFVDNGSTDRSAELCKEFGGMVLNCEKPGAAAARNVGLTAAKGEYISFFDSDDEMSPTFIADMVAFEADLAVARTRSVFPDGHTMVRARGGESPAAHIIVQGLNTASWVARTELVRRVGGWDDSLRMWDDYELGVRLLLASRATAWSDSIYHRTYEYDGPRLTTTAGKLRVERATQALEAIERTCKKNGDKTLLYALRLRSAIVRGQMERDSLDARCIECHGLFPTLLRLYTRFGGRGAWRIALLASRLTTF